MSKKPAISASLQSLIATSDVRLMTSAERNEQKRFFNYVSRHYKWHTSSIDWSNRDNIRQLQLETADDATLTAFIRRMPLADYSYVAVMPASAGHISLVAPFDALLHHFDLLVSTGIYVFLAGITWPDNRPKIYESHFLEFRLHGGMWLTGELPHEKT